MQRDHIKLRLQESTRDMKSCDASETKGEVQAKAEDPQKNRRDETARSKPGSSKVCFITERFHPFSPSLFLLSYFSVYSISWSLVTSFQSVLIHSQSIRILILRKADQDKILLFSIRIIANIILELTDFSIILFKNNYCCNIYFLKVTDILSQNPLFAECILILEVLELKVNGFLILGFPMFFFNREF